MVIPDIILVQLPCVSDMLLHEIISGDRLLYQQIAPILFILDVVPRFKILSDRKAAAI